MPSEPLSGMALGGDVTLAPVGPRDEKLLRDWLTRPHVSRWWGDPAPAWTAVANHPDEDRAVIVVADRSVGYVQWQRLSRAEVEMAGLESLPENHLDVDILIGEPELIGRGVGPEALRLVVQRLWAKGVESLGVGTDDANRSARRAFEKAGFRIAASFEEGGRRMSYLIRPPGSSLAPPRPAPHLDRP